MQDGHIAAPQGACPVGAGVCECGKNKPACVQRGISGCPSAGRKTEQMQEDSESCSALRSLTVAAKGLSEEVALEGLGKEPPGRGGSKCKQPVSGSKALSFFRLSLKKLSFVFLSSTKTSVVKEHELGEKGRGSSERSAEAISLRPCRAWKEI